MQLEVPGESILYRGVSICGYLIQLYGRRGPMSPILGHTIGEDSQLLLEPSGRLVRTSGSKDL